MKQNQGMTLLHVMVLMTLLSLILMSELRNKGSRNDMQAYEYTLAQTNGVLNNAFSYYQKNGEWPHDGSGGCATYPSDQKNGWGVLVRCEFPTGKTYQNAKEYRLRQYIPKKYGALYEIAFEDDDAKSVTRIGAHNPPPEFDAYSVTVDRTGGADQMLDFFKLSNSTGSPAEVEKMECPPDEEVDSFMALGAMEFHQYPVGEAYYPNPSWFGTCDTAFVSVIPPKVSLGFHYKITDDPPAYKLAYNMYRMRYINNYAYLGLTEESLKVNQGCDFPHDYDDLEGNDGHLNAESEVNHERIKTAVFQHCKPKP